MGIKLDNLFKVIADREIVCKSTGFVLKTLEKSSLVLNIDAIKIDDFRERRRKNVLNFLIKRLKTLG